MSLALSRGRASYEVGRQVLLEAAHLLAAAGISLMPLKGIWLQYAVYDDPGDRTITDVDALVPERQYSAALATLQAAGWTLLGSNSSAAALRVAGWPLPLDLHRRLFTPGAFHMPTDELFARGTRNRRAFEIEVVLPDPLDVFAHLVGHFVKSRGGCDTESNELRDLPALAARFALDATRTARHLEYCGLARASRYALQCVAASGNGSTFCVETLARLKQDRRGDMYAAAMLGLRVRFPRTSPIAALPGFILERSLARAMRSFTARAWDRRHDRKHVRGGSG